MNQRFTLDGDDRLEQRLCELCNDVAAEVQRIVPRKELEAVILGGGYGRGEGGVLKTSNGDAPYNDMEFYVCIAGNAVRNNHSFSEALHGLAEKLSHKATIEVEFKITSLRKLRAESCTMFFYDLAAGHRVVLGDRDVLANSQPDSSAIPLFEATRLLMNRCSGLLFSEDKLRNDAFNPESADFVGRNQAKAQLAFGDVILTVAGQYHWSCRERFSRLQKLSIDAPRLAQIRCHHALGVEFKLHPQKKNGTRESFQPLQAELIEIGRELWLWLESKRLNETFAGPRNYSFSTVNKCPETSAVRNTIINGIKLGRRALISPKATRYPRERLLESLPLLLWDSLTTAEVLPRLQRNLLTTAHTFSGLVSAYSKIWQRFN